MSESVNLKDMTEILENKESNEEFCRICGGTSNIVGYNASKLPICSRCAKSWKIPIYSCSYFAKKCA